MSALDPLRSLWARVRVGELRTLPIALVLGLLWLVLAAIDPTFLSADNLVNLTQQSVVVGILALGVVLTLHVGQLDLSVGAVSGLAAALVAVGVVHGGWPLWLAVLLALVVGGLVGSAYGLAYTRLAVPVVVFTLAGLLAVTGLQLRVLGTTGSVNLPFESWLVELAQTLYLSPGTSWTLVVVLVVGYAVSLFVTRARRLRAELPAASVARLAVQVVAVAVGLGVVVAYLGTNRGVGAIFAIFVGLVGAVDLLLRRTRWGRWVRAVGGDAEAARRAGVPVRLVLVTVFVGCSTLAVLGGVVAAGRLAAANQATGAPEVMLLAIAAAVIGGTSLFGGRGSAWSALLGALVVQSISNGLILLNQDTSARLIVTGIVLAGAVTIDALMRRAREAA
ncbi:sugar ABC transporter permease [Cellulomonas composti]|uniref:Xylose transport system permease protein XylH n=1 Tax=Cellulomonas composti TaxID=266130 RepID=A0A511J987_9CELL|nr:sugar ABC transporter permease [Cellulomonas composti]GEL94557.1 ABC transporter permease [Cellulomonas composti]